MRENGIRIGEVGRTNNNNNKNNKIRLSFFLVKSILFNQQNFALIRRNKEGEKNQIFARRTKKFSRFLSGCPNGILQSSKSYTHTIR